MTGAIRTMMSPRTARSARYHGLPVPSTMRALRKTRSYGFSAACTNMPPKNQIDSPIRTSLSVRLLTTRTSHSSPITHHSSLRTHHAQIDQHALQHLILRIEMLARFRRARESAGPGVVVQLLPPLLAFDEFRERLIPESRLGGGQPPGPREPPPRVVLGGYALLAQSGHVGEPAGLPLARAQAEYACRTRLLVVLRAARRSDPYVDVPANRRRHALSA